MLGHGLRINRLLSRRLTPTKVRYEYTDKKTYNRCDKKMRRKQLAVVFWNEAGGEKHTEANPDKHTANVSSYSIRNKRELFFCDSYFHKNLSWPNIILTRAGVA